MELSAPPYIAFKGMYDIIYDIIDDITEIDIDGTFHITNNNIAANTN